MKLIFFDIDNTILDFDEYVRQSMRDGFNKFNLKEYEPWMYDVFTTENNKLWKKIEEQRLDFDELKKIRWNIIFDKLNIDFDGEIFENYFQKYLNESAVPVEGAYKVLKKAKEKYVVCAASNGPYNQQLHRIELADMRRYFDYIFISEKVGASKPDAKFFDYAFSKINEKREIPIKPESCMIVGDSISSDMESGIRYKMRTCFFDRKKNR